VNVKTYLQLISITFMNFSELQILHLSDTHKLQNLMGNVYHQKKKLSEDE